jgi:hypothetical protein
MLRMAKRRYARVEAVLNRVERMKKTTPAILEDMQIELANAGKDEMQRIIETSGIGRPWQSPLPAKVLPRSGQLRTSSSPGRVNTGTMRDAVRVRFEGQGERKIAAFGWIDAPSSDQKYFEAQEYGFRAGGFRRPMQVIGMFALRDARRYVVNQVLPRVARKYQNRINRSA